MPPLLSDIASKSSLHILGVTLTINLSASDHILGVLASQVFTDTVCATCSTPSRSLWCWSTNCLSKRHRGQAAVCLARLERIHDCRWPSTSQRISSQKQAMWFLPTRLADIRGIVGEQWWTII